MTGTEHSPRPISAGRRFFALAPWWQLAIAYIPVLAVSMIAIFAMVEPDRDWSVTLISAGASSVLTGILIGALLGRQRAQARAALGEPSDEDYLAIVSATRRGPVPTDPTIRGGAHRLVARQLERQRGRSQMLALSLFGLATAASVAAAVQGSPGQWIVAMLLAFVMVNFVVTRAWLRHREKQLRPTAD